MKEDVSVLRFSFMRSGLLGVMLILLLFCSNALFAQTLNKIVKRSYSIDEGLPSNRVYSVVRDSIGFIWMGTNNGLVRFDGNEFRKFRFDNRDTTSISSNSIQSLLVDSDQKLWIALDNGVDIYNPDADAFQHFVFKTKNGESIKGRTTDILEDSEGEIWIATANNGVFRFSKKDDRLQHYTHITGDSSSLAQNKITTLSKGAKNDIWVGTDSKGVCRFSKKTEKFTNYQTHGDSTSLSGNAIQKIFKDSYDNIWIGTRNHGISRFNYDSNTFINFEPDHKNKLLYHIQDISEFKSGKLLVASDNGVGIFDIEESELSYDKVLNSAILPETNKYVYSILKDYENGLWLGSYFNGIEYIPSTQQNFKFFSTETEGKGAVVNSIIEGKNNCFWIGTDNNGIFQYDAKNDTVIPFKTARDIHSSYYNIHELLIDNGNILAATYGRGLESFDLKTGRVSSFLHDPDDSTSISSSRVFSLLKSNEGKVYVGTSNGVDYFNKKKNKFEPLPISDRIIKMLEDNQNNIWMATNNNGLYKYDYEYDKYIHYQNIPHDKNSLGSNALSSLALDTKGNIWVGLRGYGINKYNVDEDVFTRYEDLDLPNEVISSIIPDGNYLWLATNNGLVRWNPKTNKYKIFDKSNGLFNEQFSSGASIISKSENIYLGTADGFMEFAPNKLTKNSFKPSIVVTKLYINNELINFNDENSPLKRPIVQTQDLVLNYKQSNIKISFASLSFTWPRNNIFKYKLEGYDEKWNTTDYKNQSLTYTNLPSGDYILRIKGTNNDLVWSEDEVKINIEIKPHFLKSNLAFVLYALLIIGGVWWSVSYFLKSSERRHNEKMKLLKAETQKAIYDSKIEFFTNMTHEIKTPLSLIMGPLEYIAESSVIQEKYGEYLSIIQLNCNRLFSLVTQLLDFRKVDSGVFKIHDTFIDFSVFIEELITQFKGEAQKNGIEVNVCLEPNNFFILTDEAALSKILTNLISNALKFAVEEVKITGTEKESCYVISVENDGKEIAEEERDKIFEAFYQTKEGEGRGIGVGLNMTKTLVVMLGGDIRVSERPDSLPGTKFVFQLPRKKVDNENNLTKLKEAEDGKGTGEELTGINEEDKVAKKILLVEDNREVQDFLTRILEEEYALYKAVDGKEALTSLKGNQIDLVVSDIMMQGMDGLELCNRIREDIETSHIPIILLTAKTELETKLKGLNLGIDAFIEKPFSPKQLKAQVKNLLIKREELKNEFASASSSTAIVPTHNKLDEEFVMRCNSIINENISFSKFSVDKLAKELTMSRTLMFRKIKAITGMTPNNYIKMLRLKEGARLLQAGEYTITEIGYLVGFNSPSYFSKNFSDYFGKTPSEFVNS